MQSRISPLLCAIALLCASSAAAQGPLRVCAEPNDLPFSNTKREGFENKLAEMIAKELRENLVYVWISEREHFVKKTLDAGKCDAIMGVPAGFNEVDTTQPYYASTYVFVSRRDSHLDLQSMRDPRLRKLRIGVHLIGDDNAPPMEALSRQGIVRNVIGYMIFGDSRQPNPPARLIEAVAQKKVDIAAVWGPLGGYFAQRSTVPLTLMPITDAAAFAPAAFQYAIAMGVRKGGHALRARLDQILARHRSEIRNLLKTYGVPLVRVNQAGGTG